MSCGIFSEWGLIEKKSQKMNLYWEANQTIIDAATFWVLSI